MTDVSPSTGGDRATTQTEYEFPIPVDTFDGVDDVRACLLAGDLSDLTGSLLLVACGLWGTRTRDDSSVRWAFIKGQRAMPMPRRLWPGSPERPECDEARGRPP